MTIKDVLDWGKQELNKSKISEPEASALVLLGDILGLRRAEILAKSDQALTKEQEKKFSEYIKRRQGQESVWHIIGYKVFWGLPISVTSDVLVPRPETEMLVENVVNYILSLGDTKETLKMLDVGTGSGAIAIALANEFSGIEITACDISEKALKVAKKNAKDLGVGKFIKFLRSDLFENIEGKFDIVTANLPYIPTRDIASLSPEVSKFDPALALDGGKNGLEIFERFFAEIGDHLAEDSYVICEIGIGQGKPFQKLVKKYLPESDCMVLKDFANIDRIGIIKLGRK